jgi:hypothetical protein
MRSLTNPRERTAGLFRWIDSRRGKEKRSAGIAPGECHRAARSPGPWRAVRFGCMRSAKMEPKPNIARHPAARSDPPPRPRRRAAPRDRAQLQRQSGDDFEAPLGADTTLIIQTAHELKISRLYHYQRFNPDWIRQILFDRKIYFSNPANFNDPWDCRPYFNIPPAGQQVIA